MSNRKEIHKIYRARKELKKMNKGQTIFRPVKPDEYSEDVQKDILNRGSVVVSRNSKCPCGSRKRFKRCHGLKKGEMKWVDYIFQNNKT